MARQDTREARGNRRAEPIGVGVLGGSGYIGAELLRYLAMHPLAELRWATAHARCGEAIGDVLPNLRGVLEGAFISEEEACERLDEVAAVFLALPHNQSQNVLPRLASLHPEKVFIDMAGDFRTPDPEGYRRYYGKEHAAPEWLERFAYGFTEFHREELRGARLIANPGCFATGVLLALAPLARAGCLPREVCITGITGSSGAGNKPVQTTHHPERATNVRAYKPLVHQHLLEVGGCLTRLGASPDVRLHFVPQSGPFVRGIFTTVFTPGLGPEELGRVFKAAYAGEPLVSLVEGSPDLRWVQGSPRSFVGWAGEGGNGVVFTAIDNLGKGAASQAIQNLNLACGLEETAGLLWAGGFV